MPGTDFDNIYGNSDKKGKSVQDPDLYGGGVASRAPTFDKIVRNDNRPSEEHQRVELECISLFQVPAVDINPP